MHRIKLSQAVPGMVLAQPVTLGGVVLCGEGTELTARVISRLARREIQTIVVRGEAPETGPEQEARVTRVKQAIDRRFRRLANDEFMMGIKAVFERQFGLTPPEPDEGE